MYKHMEFELMSQGKRRFIKKAGRIKTAARFLYMFIGTYSAGSETLAASASACFA